MTQFSLEFRSVETALARAAGRPAPILARRGAALLLALCLLGQSAGAREEWVDREPRWIPSLHFGFDAFEYDTQASVLNQINPPRQAGTQNDGSRLIMLQFGGEVMGPLFKGLPGRPRLFAQAGAQWSPFASDNVFELGVGGNTAAHISGYQQVLARDEARGCQGAGCPPRPEIFSGEGSEIDANFLNPSWNAALGVAFTFPVAESLLLRVKPSIAYNLDRIELSGTITTVVDTGETMFLPVANPPPPHPAPCIGNSCPVPVFEIHRGSASDSITQHSLGPGLELELVLFRGVRPIRASLYADTRFLWLLGDRTTEFSGSVASYEVRRDPFAIRGGAGFRFSWMGSGGR